MALSQYGVLVGQAVDTRSEGGADTPHFQIHVRAGSTHFRVAVNVLSQMAPPDLLYVAVEPFEHPLLTSLRDLPDGFSPLASAVGGSALDYIRGNLADRTAFRPVAATAPGPDNDLADFLAHYLGRAVADPGARVFAFGQRWGPEQGTPDKIFGFSPGNGVHDVHMNQGNSGAFVRDDGVWQDGGLLLHLAVTDQWVAMLLAFQSQSWHTNDTTGHALDVEPGPTPGPSDPQRRVRVVASLVNPVGPAPEHETVTVLNRGSEQIDLDGWSLVDRLGQRMTLGSSVVAAGDALRIPVAAPVQLGNRGGTITLLDADGLKVDGVAYTAAQAGEEGTTIVF